MAEPDQEARLGSRSLAPRSTSSLRSVFTRTPGSTRTQRSAAVDNIYVVENPILIVEPTALLTTRLGTYLLERHVMSSVLYLICLICIILFFVPMGHPTKYEAHDSTGLLRELERPNSIQNFVGAVFAVAGMLLNAHQMNKQIFKTCALSFDFMVIVGSGLMVQLVWYINWYMVFFRAGKWAWEEIPLMILEFVASMFFYVTIGSLDCIKMRYTRKVAICSTLMVSFLAEFVLVRFDWRYGSFFADETLDWWLISTTPDEIYISSKLQLMLFLGKASLAYAYGQPFCCLKPDYEVPGRGEVLARRLVRQLSDTLTPHSLRSSTAEFGSDLEAQVSQVIQEENKKSEEKISSTDLRTACV